MIETSTVPRPDLMQTPIPNSDLMLYTDGFSSRPSDNTYLAGYAVVNDWKAIEARGLPHGTSAQAAELYALIRASTLAKDKVATTYTDSLYAFSAVSDCLLDRSGFFDLCGTSMDLPATNTAHYVALLQ